MNVSAKTKVALLANNVKLANKHLRQVGCHQEGLTHLLEAAREIQSIRSKLTLTTGDKISRKQGKWWGAVGSLEKKLNAATGRFRACVKVD
jgi:hypothetical protein